LSARVKERHCETAGQQAQLDTAADSLSPPERERVGARGFELENNQPSHPAPLLLWRRRGRKMEWYQIAPGERLAELFVRTPSARLLFYVPN